MGLDMYLQRMPRYRGTTAEQISLIDSYLSWIENEESHNKYTLKEWCGIEEKDLPGQKVIEFYKQFRKENEYGYKHISENVGYWRKANHIHNWFVENIQDGIDDCGYHREVTEDDLTNLLDICNTVLESCAMTYGKVEAGKRMENGEWITEYTDGKRVIDTGVAEELLPTQSGFFFGGTDYDEWYVQDVAETIKIIEKVLAETDFDTQMIYYVSSW